MSIRHWPSAERPREKLIHKGAHTLSDAELLAIFLRTGTPGKSAVDLARELLNEFGGLRPLLKANLKRFCQAKGLGNAKFAQLQCVMEMARRHLASELEESIEANSADKVKEYVKSQLRHSEREVFAMLSLDSQYRLIHFDKVFYGTIDSAEVHPREIIKLALAHNAKAIIFAHNHPSGVAEPSAADIHITQHMQSALAMVDIKVLDHLIVGNKDVLSMAERGLM